jgi:hypothetical protein
VGLTDADSYRRLRERREPNLPRDMSLDWERFTPVSDATGSVLSRIGYWAQSKGFTVRALELQEVGFRIDRNGGVTLAYPVRTLEGAIVAIKLRGLDGKKNCVPGSRLKYPAMPSLYGAGNPRRVFVCEGESDAAFLLEHIQETDAVLCCHAGAGVFCPEWIGGIPDSASEVFICSDNDYDRRPAYPGDVANIGEQFAQKWLARVPGSKRLKPPFPAKDWCEVVELQSGRND